jgi:hypothetical protein
LTDQGGGKRRSLGPQAAFDFRNLVIGRGQHIADDLAIIRLILDHENALAHAASTNLLLTRHAEKKRGQQ